MKTKNAASVKSFRFAEDLQEKLSARFARNAKGSRFIGDLQRVVDEHLRTRMRVGQAAVPSMPVIRANASAIQRDARELAKRIALLTPREKDMLGQLMWTVDKQHYYPRGFSVERLQGSIQVLEQAARRINRGAGAGGLPRLQLDSLIRDVHAAYAVRFNQQPQITMARDNDFMFALKVCLASGVSTGRAAS